MAKRKEIKIRITNSKPQPEKSVEIPTKSEPLPESIDSLNWEIKNLDSGFKGKDVLILLALLGGGYYAFIKHDYILLTLVIALAFTYLVISLSQKESTKVQLTAKGLTLDNQYYPLEQFKKFELKTIKENSYLILAFKNAILPPLQIPLDDKNKIDNIKKLIADKLPEEPISGWWEKWAK